VGKGSLLPAAAFKVHQLRNHKKNSVGQNYTKKEVTHEKKKFNENEVSFKKRNNCQLEYC
jgi:hypothetical protein